MDGGAAAWATMTVLMPYVVTPAKVPAFNQVKPHLEFREIQWLRSCDKIVTISVETDNISRLMKAQVPGAGRIVFLFRIRFHVTRAGTGPRIIVARLRFIQGLTFNLSNNHLAHRCWNWGGQEVSSGNKKSDQTRAFRDRQTSFPVMKSENYHTGGIGLPFLSNLSWVFKKKSDTLWDYTQYLI